MSGEDNALALMQANGPGRRKGQRKKSLWSALLVTDAGSFGCHVLDLSDSGARIESSAKVSPEEAITLIADPIGTRTGHVVWRDETGFGMQFSPRQGEASTSDATAPAAALGEGEGQIQGETLTFVEFTRFQGTSVFVNPAQVLYVAAQANDKHCEIHFGNDHAIVVKGDCKRICSQLVRRQAGKIA